jgi:hypothetical protein
MVNPNIFRNVSLDNLKKYEGGSLLSKTDFHRNMSKMTNLYE